MPAWWKTERQMALVGFPFINQLNWEKCVPKRLLQYTAVICLLSLSPVNSALLTFCSFMVQDVHDTKINSHFIPIEH